MLISTTFHALGNAHFKVDTVILPVRKLFVNYTSISRGESAFLQPRKSEGAKINGRANRNSKEKPHQAQQYKQ
jgi:hypothetical protein